MAFVFFAATQFKATDDASGTMQSTVTAVPQQNLFSVDISNLLESAANPIVDLTRARQMLSALGASVLFVATAYDVNKSQCASPKRGPLNQLSLVRPANSGNECS
ncbi:hypothetical protein [Bradyrhizobium sp.]|uniref:hypothetical protein n=1 Tax=Bradyrhizobium sp. TaxID=376 RepID=UPI0027347E6F|nr:hypothetical protein [Bradyrhizobium sp.]